MNDGIMILLIFATIIVIPTGIAFMILAINRRNRRKKISSYTGVTSGKILKITNKGLDYPYVIQVGYSVNGVNYEIKETAKLKSQIIKAGFLPIGQKKVFVLGEVKTGDFVKIHYDENNPQKGIIYGNEGTVTS